MDWQQFLSLVIVASAAGLMGWSKLRRQKFGIERETCCACATVPRSRPRHSIVFRARKGERSEVRVRMG